MTSRFPVDPLTAISRMAREIAKTTRQEAGNFEQLTEQLIPFGLMCLNEVHAIQSFESESIV